MTPSITQIPKSGQKKIFWRTGSQTVRNASSIIASSGPTRLHTARRQLSNAFDREIGSTTSGRKLKRHDLIYFSSTIGFAHSQSTSNGPSSTSVTKDQNVSTKSATSQTSYSSDRAQGRVILITGGTSGIGFEIVKQALLNGALHVRIVTRNSKRGQDAVDRLRAVLSVDSSIDVVQAEADEYGESRLFAPPPDSPNLTFNTLIHSAGISQTSLLSSTPTSTISQILDVNLKSASLLSKQFLKQYMQHLRRRPPSQTDTETMQQVPSWTITNISSLLAQRSGVGSSIYAASKAGLTALTRTTALEGAEIRKRYRSNDGDGDKVDLPGFRANVVVPGYIETPMTENFSNSTKQILLDQIPARRLGRSDEVADAVMFLLGNEYANNCVLGLDGGLSGV